MAKIYFLLIGWFLPFRLNKIPEIGTMPTTWGNLSKKFFYGKVIRHWEERTEGHKYKRGITAVCFNLGGVK